MCEYNKQADIATACVQVTKMQSDVKSDPANIQKKQEKLQGARKNFEQMHGELMEEMQVRVWGCRRVCVLLLRVAHC